MKTLRMITALLMILPGLIGSAWATQAGDLLGNWQLVEATYDAQEITDLSAILYISDETHYVAEFDDGVDYGYVDGQFAVEDSVFYSNADDQYVVRNGENFELKCCPVERLWKTFLYCTNATYESWGATPLGFDDPWITVEDDQLIITSSDALTQLTYERTIEPVFGVYQVVLEQGVCYDVNGEALYEMRVEIVSNSQVTSIDCNSPGTAAWTMEPISSINDGVEINYEYNAQDRMYHWSYLAQYAQESDLDRYRDPNNSTFLFTLYLADGTVETTGVDFTADDGTDLEAVTQVPSLIDPVPGSEEVPVEVTFVFEAPAQDAWQTQLAWDDEQSELLPATQSTYGPVTLDSNSVVYLDLSILNQDTGYNEDLISTQVAMTATSTFSFTTEKVFVIPDEALLAGIQAALGIEEVTAEDMLLLTSLTLPNAGIQDLTGLEKAENLESLLLGGNDIEDLDALAELVNLQILDLHDNAIADLTALQGLESLMELSLKNNQIQSLEALSGLIRLKRINLATNAIVDLTALQDLILLEALWLNENYIEDLSALTSLNNLTVLNVCDNELSKSDCADLAILQAIIDGNNGWLSADLNCD